MDVAVEHGPHWVFSSDRSISEYCNNIWAVDPLNVEITWTCAEGSNKKALGLYPGLCTVINCFSSDRASPASGATDG